MTVEEFVAFNGGIEAVAKIANACEASVKLWIRQNRMPLHLGAQFGLTMKKAPPGKHNAGIADLDYADIASPPPLQDHRFGEMIKGKHYAYARGLTINPIHLPVALDAMMEDGWELMAVFGDTKSDRVGFVFKKIVRGA